MSDPKPAFSRLRLSLPVLLLALSSSRSLAIESSLVIEEMGTASEETAAFQNLLFVDPRGTHHNQAVEYDSKKDLSLYLAE